MYILIETKYHPGRSLSGHEGLFSSVSKTGGVINNFYECLECLKNLGVFKKCFRKKKQSRETLHFLQRTMLTIISRTKTIQKIPRKGYESSEFLQIPARFPNVFLNAQRRHWLLKIFELTNGERTRKSSQNLGNIVVV